ncbi:hypothetical protein BDW22DRAFT_677495 [Trametopsis cervina]|nr:hypothetical protein BDW22DRAFT_677495 [Trametopsis cervina]
MMMIFTTPLLALLLATSGALANPAPAAPFNPTKALTGTPLEMALTNGQRMARGLPPNKPHFRRHLRARAGPSAVAAAANPAPTGTCTPRTGVVHVSATDPARPVLDGYLGRTANEFGEYTYTAERANALSVTLDDCSGAPFDLLTTNGFKTFPYLGAIKGFSSDDAELRPGAFNYLYIGGVSQTAPRATPQTVGNSFSGTTGEAEPSESAIWSFASGGGDVLQPQWINPDGSLPRNTLVYVPSRNVFALVGDVPAFEQMFENASPVTLVFQA